MLRDPKHVSLLKSVAQILNLFLNTQVIIFPIQKQDMSTSVSDFVPLRPYGLDGVVNVGCDALNGGDMGACERDIVCSRFEADKSILDNIALPLVSLLACRGPPVDVLPYRQA